MNKIFIIIFGILFFTFSFISPLGLLNPNQTTIILGNITNFTDLYDVPASYSGDGSKCVVVKNDETGLEFTDCSGTINITTNYTNVALTNQSNSFTGNQSTDSFWNGKFNWALNIVSDFLEGSFDGSTLTLDVNETKLDEAIEEGSTNVSIQYGRNESDGELIVQALDEDGAQLWSIPDLVVEFWQRIGDIISPINSGDSLNMSGGNVYADDLLPAGGNNTGNVGDVDQRWEHGYFETINTSNLGGYSPINVQADLILGINNITATQYFGSGEFLTDINATNALIAEAANFTQFVNTTNLVNPGSYLYNSSLITIDFNETKLIQTIEEESTNVSINYGANESDTSGPSIPFLLTSEGVLRIQAEGNLDEIWKRIGTIISPNVVGDDISVDDGTFTGDVNVTGDLTVTGNIIPEANITDSDNSIQVFFKDGAMVIKG